MSRYLASLQLTAPPSIVEVAAVGPLERAPLFLRFVRNTRGEWDALDLQDDLPEPDEEITVGKREPGFGRIHVDRIVRGKRVGSNFETATYQPIAGPPLDVLRDNARWREWCYVQADCEAGRNLKVSD